MSYIVKSGLRHNDIRYAVGEEIDDITRDEARRLLDMGVIAKVITDAAPKTAPTATAQAKTKPEPKPKPEAAPASARALPEGLNPDLV